MEVANVLVEIVGRDHNVILAILSSTRFWIVELVLFLVIIRIVR